MTRVVAEWTDEAAKWSWFRILAVLVGIIACTVAIYYARQPLLEWGMFRQTQTALSTFWMLEEGLQFPYQTPVVGYPWELPFEFPIYQYLVALIVWVTGFPIDPVGRLLSFAFLLACAWPAFRIARRLALPAGAAWLFLALLWSSPLYLFWGRTFMIETAAVFFLLAAIPHALDLRHPRPALRTALLLALFASLAMAQKVTTAAPVLMIMGLLVVAAHLHDAGLRFPSARKAALVVAAFAVPLAVGFAWTSYAGSVRGQNLYGQVTTFGAQGTYYIGTWGDRLDLGLLREIFWNRVVGPNAAGFLGVALLLVGLVWADRRARVVVAVCLILFALPILMFLRVHHFLPYYQTASVLFLLAALAVSVAHVLPKLTSRPMVAPLVGGVLVLANLFHFSNGYGWYLTRNMDATRTTELAVGDVIQRYTPADSAILVFGLLSEDSAYPVVSYSSQIAYYARRKAFTVEDSFEHRIWHDPASYLGGKALGAIVICAKDDLPRYEPIVRMYDPDPDAGIFEVLGCYVWLPEVETIVLADGQERDRLPISAGAGLAAPAD